MPEFLELLPPLQALEKLLSNLPLVAPLKETVPVTSALGRVTFCAVQAPEPLPAFPRSTVDGFAVRAQDTFGASDALPAYLELAGEVPMGSEPKFILQTFQAALIHTGGMLPSGADSVLMLENSQNIGGQEIEILKAVAVGENTLRVGEDVTVGQEVISGGVRLRPSEIGGMLALGIMSVEVACPPRVGILSSGDEIVMPEITPLPGQVRDINSYALSALVQQHGGEPINYGIIPDKPGPLEKVLQKALKECDAVVITAGSSASTRDLTADAIHRMGIPGVLVHGVNVRPGKPTILGVCAGKPVIGLPGNPVSAQIIARLFVAPVIDRLSGLRKHLLRPFVQAALELNLPSQAGREDWIPARLIEQGHDFIAEPIFYKSNLIFSLSQADGLIYIPPDATGIAAGEQVKVYLL